MQTDPASFVILLSHREIPVHGCDKSAFERTGPPSTEQLPLDLKQSQLVLIYRDLIEKRYLIF